MLAADCWCDITPDLACDHRVRRVWWCLMPATLSDAKELHNALLIADEVRHIDEVLSFTCQYQVPSMTIWF